MYCQTECVFQGLLTVIIRVILISAAMKGPLSTLIRILLFLYFITQLISPDFSHCQLPSKVDVNQ